MSTNSSKNIRSMVLGVIVPKIVSIRENFRSFLEQLFNKKVILQKEATAEFNTEDMLVSGTIQVPVTVTDDGHSHTSSQISGSEKAEPNTIVKRDASGKIHGSGNVYKDTGFKLSDGRDVTALFYDVNQYPYTATTITNGSGNYISGISITVDASANIVLTQNKANFCPVYTHPDVHKDGC